VVANGPLEEGEPFGVEGEEDADEGGEGIGGAGAVAGVVAVVEAAGVVEDGEEGDDGLVGAGLGGQLEAVLLDAGSVQRTVDRALSTGEDRLRVTADGFPVFVGETRGFEGGWIHVQ
jgi:hypothetical protein